MFRTLLLALTVMPLLSGCLGNSALTAKAKKANLLLTENRWGREGIFLGFNFLWVYRVCTLLDLFVFNSIEFWTGENPINGANPLVDLPMDMVEKIGMKDVAGGKIERLDKNHAKLYLDFTNGDKVSMDVIRTGNSYTVSYLGKKFFSGEIQD